MTPPLILAFDTTGPHIAVACLRGDTCFHAALEPMAKGQGERLTFLISETAQASGIPLESLDLIAVGTGPGNYTGSRIGVAMARGLALSLRRPAMGVTGFDALAIAAVSGDLLVSLPAPRGQVYLQRIARGLPPTPPCLLNPTEAATDFAGVPTVMGAEAAVLAKTLGAEIVVSPIKNPAEAIGRAALQRWNAGETTPDRPAPTYIMPVGAAPPSDPPPLILP